MGVLYMSEMLITEQRQRSWKHTFTDVVLSTELRYSVTNTPVILRGLLIWSFLTRILLRRPWLWTIPCLEEDRLRLERRGRTGPVFPRQTEDRGEHEGEGWEEQHRTSTMDTNPGAEEGASQEVDGHHGL